MILAVIQRTIDSVDAEYSRSMQGNCVPSQISKLYLMYSATYAASVAVEFAKGNVEDRVVDNPPSRNVGRTPVTLSSPLHGC